MEDAVKHIIFDGEYLFSHSETAPEFGDAPIRTVFDRPQTALWNEKNWFCAEILAEQYSDVGLQIAFRSETGREVLVKYELLPNLKVSFRVRIDEIWNRRYFLEVFPGSYKGYVSGLPMDPQDVCRIEITVFPGKDFKKAAIWKVWIDEDCPGGVDPEAPVIDEMGQLIGYEWPEKTHSIREMEDRLRTEYEEAMREDHLFPGRSHWGGFLHKQFEATGWFRVQHDGRRWWLVDPEGYAFFSHGICYGTRMGEFGWYTGREKFYRDAPEPNDPRFADAFIHPCQIDEYVKRYGETVCSDGWMYNPARANMIRVFGEAWWEVWRRLATYRFHQWGINTMGVGVVNYTDERCEDFLRLSELPYVLSLKHFPTTEHTIFRDFPDVFSPEYAENAGIFAEKELGPHAKNHHLIGYFLTNEPEWLFQPDCNIAWELLVNRARLRSREHLIGWLRDRYDRIEKLNAAWGLSLDSYEALREPLSRDITISDLGWKDLEEYEQIMIDAFSGIPLKVCREIAPNHLCLGMRYGSFNQKVLMSCKAFDVISFNIYSKTPEEKLRLAGITEKPMMIGEWHFGDPDGGMLRTGLLSVENQEERGKAYRRYCEVCAAEPNCVGIHYFEYNNQTLMGRFDGEHASHGLIDCCNHPYPYMAEAIKTSSGNLYAVMNGEKPPYDEPVEYQRHKW